MMFNCTCDISTAINITGCCFIIDHFIDCILLIGALWIYVLYCAVNGIETILLDWKNMDFIMKLMMIIGK